MKLLGVLLIPTLLSSNLLFANEPSADPSLEKNKLLIPQETKELKSKNKKSKKLKSKADSEMPKSKKAQEEEAPPAPPAY